MRYLINTFVLVCVIGMITGAKAQGGLDFVYGEVSYDSQNGVEVITTFATPMIDIITLDTSGTITTGIPPVLTITETVNTEEVPPLEGITVYPVPMGEHLNLHRTQAASPYELEFVNSTGQVVQRSRWAAGEQFKQLDTDVLPPGQYFLLIRDLRSGALSTYGVMKAQ